MGSAVADRITVLTPTCDRPVAFALCERWMRAQTRQPDEWIVADGGRTPVIRRWDSGTSTRRALPGALNFTGNLRARARRGDRRRAGGRRGRRLDTARSISRSSRRNSCVPASRLRATRRSGITTCRRGGGGRSQNTGASLCQTGLRRDGFPWLQRAIEEATRAGRYGVDFALWQQAPPARSRLSGRDTVVGIKGLPGRPGLGIGHRPSGPIVAA